MILYEDDIKRFDRTQSTLRGTRLCFSGPLLLLPPSNLACILLFRPVSLVLHLWTGSGDNGRLRTLFLACRFRIPLRNLKIMPAVPQPLTQTIGASTCYDNQHFRFFMGTNTGYAWTHPSVMGPLDFFFVATGKRSLEPYRFALCTSQNHWIMCIGG